MKVTRYSFPSPNEDAAPDAMWNAYIVSGGGMNMDHVYFVDEHHVQRSGDAQLFVKALSTMFSDVNEDPYSPVSHVDIVHAMVSHLRAQKLYLGSLMLTRFVERVPARIFASHLNIVEDVLNLVGDCFADMPRGDAYRLLCKLFSHIKYEDMCFMYKLKYSYFRDGYEFACDNESLFFAAIVGALLSNLPIPETRLSADTKESLETMFCEMPSFNTEQFDIVELHSPFALALLDKSGIFEKISKSFGKVPSNWLLVACRDATNPEMIARVGKLIKGKWMAYTGSYLARTVSPIPTQCMQAIFENRSTLHRERAVLAFFEHARDAAVRVNLTKVLFPHETDKSKITKAKLAGAYMDAVGNSVQATARLPLDLGPALIKEAAKRCNPELFEELLLDPGRHDLQLASSSVLKLVRKYASSPNTVKMPNGWTSHQRDSAVQNMCELAEKKAVEIADAKARRADDRAKKKQRRR